MQTSGIKIDLDSKNLLIENSEKIQKVIKFAVRKAVLQNESETTQKTPEKSDKHKNYVKT